MKSIMRISEAVDLVYCLREIMYVIRYANSMFAFLGRSLKNDQLSQCRGTPARLCKTRYNTTAPMYGVSLTSGQPVTIVQKFPDLLQQVVFEVCE